MKKPFAVRRLKSAERKEFCIDIVQARSKVPGKRGDEYNKSGWYKKLKRQDLVERYRKFIGGTELDPTELGTQLRYWALMLSEEEEKEYWSLERLPWRQPGARKRYECLKNLYNAEMDGKDPKAFRDALDKAPLMTALWPPSRSWSEGEDSFSVGVSSQSTKESSTFTSDEARQDSMFNGASPKRGDKPHKERSRKGEIHIKSELNAYHAYDPFSGRESFQDEKYPGHRAVSEDYGLLTEEPGQYGDFLSSYAAHSNGPSGINARAYTVPHSVPGSFASPSHGRPDQSYYIPNYDTGYNAHHQPYEACFDSRYATRPRNLSSASSVFPGSANISGNGHSTRRPSYPSYNPPSDTSYSRYQ